MLTTELATLSPRVFKEWLDTTGADRKLICGNVNKCALAQFFASEVVFPEGTSFVAVENADSYEFDDEDIERAGYAEEDAEDSEVTVAYFSRTRGSTRSEAGTEFFLLPAWCHEFIGLFDTSGRVEQSKVVDGENVTYLYGAETAPLVCEVADC